MKFGTVKDHGRTYKVYLNCYLTKRLSLAVVLILRLCEISSSHGGEYEAQICLLGCTAV
jgi:hypothetical protein